MGRLDRHPRAIVIAGPNGAGKTTAAPYLLRDELHIDTYVDADVIARGLAAFATDTAAREAGAAMLARLDRLQAERESFGFESTLAGRSHVKRLRSLLAAGYSVEIFYLWLPSPDLAVDRVKLRVRHGGHDIPEAVIRRRYRRSPRNFVELYRPLASAWHVYDGSVVHTAAGAPLVARGYAGRVAEIRDVAIWGRMVRQLRIREIARSAYARRLDQDGELHRRLDLAMTRAFHAAVRLHRMHEVPVAVWEDGGVRHVDARDIRLPDDDATCHAQRR